MAISTRNQEAIEQLPVALRAFLDLERYHLHSLDVFQVASRDPEFEQAYFPQNNCGAFELPCFWVDRARTYVYGRQDDDAAELKLLVKEGLQEKVLFPIHPTSLREYRDFLTHARAEESSKAGLRIWAVPTSSTRTVLAWPDGLPDQAIFLKTTLHSPIFGDRRLSRARVASSVGLWQMVQRQKADLPQALSFFPEPLGLVPRRMQDSGAIARSIPGAVKQGDVVVAPLFSLVGAAATRTPLLLTVIERTGIEPIELLEQTLCAPFARLWVELAFDFGLLLEAHAQDLMLVLSPDLHPLNRFVYRDFEGLQVDWELRRARNLVEPDALPQASRWFETYGSWGYPWSQLVWFKWKISLLDYLHFVLSKTEESICDWQKRGVVGGRGVEPQSATALFSHYVFRELRRKFNASPSAEYNIYSDLHRFLLFLMKVRRELIEATRARAARDQSAVVVAR